MYHWYLLLRSLKSPKVAAVGVVGCARFSAFHGPEVEVTAEVHKKMFWLGAVEFSPVPLGLGAGMFFESNFAFGWAFCASLVLSGMLCWALRKKVLPTVIHVMAATKPDAQSEVINPS